MANSNGPNGLFPRRHYLGGVERLNGYTIASGLAANIFKGDLVKSTGTGRDITVCAAGDRAIGVFGGVNFTAADGTVTFRPNWITGATLAAGTVAEALVYDDPNIVFEIQVSNGFALADVGSVADIVATAGNSSTGLSAHALDSATIANTGSAQLKIVGPSLNPTNEIGQYSRVLVLINEHELKAAMTAV